MSSGNVEPKHDATKVDLVDTELLQEKNIHGSEVLVNQDLMISAFDGENREHEETLWQAVKENPMACFWAFIMCFTIVSPYV